MKSNFKNHETERIGAKIQTKLDNVSIPDATIKRSEQIRSLEHLCPGILVEKQKIHINPTLLFTRLIALVQREKQMRPYFDYGLTAIPTSLFKDSVMRKPAKAQLAKLLQMMSNQHSTISKLCMWLMMELFFIELHGQRKHSISNRVPLCTVCEDQTWVLLHCI